jgi:hypothetical protein
MVHGDDLQERYGSVWWEAYSGWIDEYTKAFQVLEDAEELGVWQTRLSRDQATKIVDLKSILLAT